MTDSGTTARIYVLHAAVVAVLVGLNFVLPEYHHAVLARVLVLAVFAMGYNMLYGYVGLLSLGHAMFFAAGLYGAGLPLYHLGWGVPAAFGAGIASGLVVSLVIGLLALQDIGRRLHDRHHDVRPGRSTSPRSISANGPRGDEGLVLPQQARQLVFGDWRLDLTDPATRYLLAVALFSAVLFATVAIVRSRHGRVLVAIRENEERTRMLGYDTFANKLAAVVTSGLICAAAGAAYALLFGYVGSTFASVQYSILPLLWVLLGGAATTLGPLIGTLFMYYVVDIASGYTSAYMLIVGAALILLVLYFRKGVVGTIRDRWARWLP